MSSFSKAASPSVCIFIFCKIDVYKTKTMVIHVSLPGCLKYLVTENAQAKPKSSYVNSRKNTYTGI